MLTQLSIKHFAIIDSLNIDLQSGMTCLTGETGAGKSILLGALGAVLGSRTESGVVKHGEQRAEICAQFELDAHADTLQKLRDLDLDDENDCILRRIITSEGRSKAYINGQAVNIKTLADIGATLVDIHGQHAHQSLMKTETQRQRLDDFGGLADLRARCTESYQAWHSVQQTLNNLSQAKQNRDERLDLLNFQLNELNALSPTTTDWEAITEQHQRLAHADSLLNTTHSALLALSEGENNAQSLINQQQTALEKASEQDPKLADIAHALQAASIQISESCSDLSHYASSIDNDPSVLSELDERMVAYHSAAHKHRLLPEQLEAHHQALLNEHAQLNDAETTLDTLTQQLNELKSTYLSHAEVLHHARCQVAEDLSHRITNAMQNLSMTGGQLTIQVERAVERMNAYGQDDVQFLVSSNPGQPLKPLSKVASGGELSRISLSIQMITAQCEPVPTLIFDEVDSGVGGAVAEVVGQSLRALSEQRQVLCVTHLAQVASQAHQQLKVEKTKSEDSTHTHITSLDQEERVEEIARMLGGIEITASTRQHANEMLQRA